jgi:protein-disulfide isomerase
MKIRTSLAALALGLAAAGCGGGGDDDGNLAAAAANNAAPLPQVPAPNNGDWTQVVSRTSQGGALMGNPDAPVKLVEYGSLTCPVCRAFSQAGTQSLRDRYVRSGQVSWEFRHLVVHGGPDVVLAMLADCQPLPAFFRTVEQIYDQQTDIMNQLDQTEEQQIQSLPPEQQLAPLARAMDLDSFFARRGMPETRFTQCLGNLQAAQRLAEAANHAFTEEGVRGTPTFFINGEVQEAASWAELEPRLRTAIGR